MNLPYDKLEITFNYYIGTIATDEPLFFLLFNYIKSPQISIYIHSKLFASFSSIFFTYSYITLILQKIIDLFVSLLVLQFAAVNNINKARFQGCASDQKSIHVLHLDQLVAVLFSHTSTVNDSAVSGLLAYAFEVWSNPVVDFIHLLCGRSFTSSNGPDWFVCQNDIVPVVDFILDCVKLSLDDFDSFVLLSFGQCFSKAEDDFQVQIKTVLDFFGDNIISLTKMSSSFRVS